jgi:O-antigen biosynthesis protein
VSTDRVIRPHVRGKFLYTEDEKFYVCGVKYGTFRPDADGGVYDPPSVERDFAQIVVHHVNTVRVYTVEPRWFLDATYRHGLRVMVSIPWEPHIAFLDDRMRVRGIEERVRGGAGLCWPPGDPLLRDWQ